MWDNFQFQLCGTCFNKLGENMGIKKMLCLCTMLLAAANSAFAGDAPSKEGSYFQGVDCNDNPVQKEIPFAEGKTPPKPCEGNFWTLITKPAIFKVETEKIQTGEATFYMKPIPAKYEWVEEKIEVAPERKIPYCQPATFARKCVEVTIQEESTRFVTVPAVYEECEEEITFRPEMEKEISVPAEYKTVMKKIEIEPERDELCEVATPTDVEINQGEQVAGSIGAIHKPARYACVAIQELVKPATTKKITVPAIKKKVMLKKLKTPAYTKEVVVPAIKKKMWVETCVAEECIRYRTVPAEFKCIRRMVLKEEARKEKIEVPAKFQEVTKKVLVTPTSMIWRQYSIGKCKAVADVCSKYGSLPGSGAF